ncbi:branched-chain amino acid ABC transporter permease [Reyranella sp. MMS21-HV4-11]|uniref:Branched-chain amino acid ABC transporter permease n=1 Tax=Reyranella humidisoli TaxID=2849149 RepID=A0ABS6IT24_9HYPH|nr:branched-chain amino acid ABC transporter permease [Reyranella sp. MMS21-HV4-11]MBU8876872.1 branched-chain amino acid ABC transporter permease [Reyranella sp. MMS21-HV4-11]
MAGRWRDLGLALLGLLLLLLVPLFGASPAIRDFIMFGMAYGLLAMSLNLLIGYTGLVSFGHAMFFAAGAYAFGLAMQSGKFSIPGAFLLAMAFTATMALVVGAICVRLNEIYFAFLTLAFQMLFYNVILGWVSFTGGDQGLMGGIPRPKFLGIDLADRTQLYIFCSVAFVVCIAILRQVVTSPFGYTLRMIRDNQERAAFLGINVPMVKLACFVISACIAGVGGILLTLFVSGAYPNFGFWTTSGEAIFMIMLGGSNVFLGPLVGTVILRLLNDITVSYTSHTELVLGVVILVLVLGLRKGPLDLLAERWENRRQAAAQAVRDAADKDAQKGRDG